MFSNNASFFGTLGHIEYLTFLSNENGIFANEVMKFV